MKYKSSINLTTKIEWFLILTSYFFIIFEFFFVPETWLKIVSLVTFFIVTFFIVWIYQDIRYNYIITGDYLVINKGKKELKKINLRKINPEIISRYNDEIGISNVHGVYGSGRIKDGIIIGKVIITPKDSVSFMTEIKKYIGDEYGN